MECVLPFSNGDLLFCFTKIEMLEFGGWVGGNTGKRVISKSCFNKKENIFYK